MDNETMQMDSSVGCQHQWFEGVCDNCGCEWCEAASSVMRPVEPPPEGGGLSPEYCEALYNFVVEQPFAEEMYATRMQMFNQVQPWDHMKPGAEITHKSQLQRARLLGPGLAQVMTVFALAALYCMFLTGLAVASPRQADDSGNYQRQYSDNDKPERARSKMIAKWDKPISIKFSNCRENEKHHISCQYRDSEGNMRWLCIMGLTEKDMGGK